MIRILASLLAGLLMAVEPDTVAGFCPDGAPVPTARRGQAGFFSVATGNPLAARAGGRWNRAFLDLTSVRGDGGGFAWTRRSGIAGEWLAGDGLELPADQEWVLCLGRLPDAWTTKPLPAAQAERWKAYPPRDWERCANLMRWIAAGLPAAVRHIEVINEPDANWRGSDEELVRYHRLVAEAMHAVRPDVRVLGPCLCAVKLDVLDRLDRLGLFDRLDGLSLHPYVNGSAPEGEFIARIDALRAWNARRARPLPIHLTEFGWQTAAGDWQLAVSERDQARYTARAQLLLAARPDIAAYHLFCLFHVRAGRWDAYSLLDADGAPRLAYAYAATAMSAAAGPPARELAPGGEVRAVLWPGAGGLRAAVWSAGAPAMLQLPGEITALRCAVGSVLPVAGRRLQVGGDPRYLECASTAIAAGLPPLRVLSGETPRLPFTDLLAAESLVVHDRDGWRVRADAPRGSWSILGRGTDGWAIQPVEVVAPVSADGALAWTDDRPVWRVALSSRLAVASEIGIALRIAGAAEERRAACHLPPGGRVELDLPLDGLPWGQRLGGTQHLAVDGEVVWRDAAPVRLTIVGIPDADAPGWERRPWLDITRWAPFIGAGQPADRLPEGLRARVRLGHGTRGLRIQAEVDEAAQLQDAAAPEMWRQDCLQLGIDVDGDAPWQPNSMRFWNGHRVVEYGLALGPDGPRTWRWRADNGLAAGTAEPRIDLQVERHGGTTRYDALLPWQVLGLDGAPAPGSRIGLALVVNDAAPEGRTGLRLFNGVAESKDPTRFGLVTLLPR